MNPENLLMKMPEGYFEERKKFYDSISNPMEPNSRIDELMMQWDFLQGYKSGSTETLNFLSREVSKNA